MAIQLSPLETNIRRIVDALIQVIQGRNNATGTFTCAASSTTTVVAAPNCSIDTQVFIRPINANARSEAGPTTTYVSAVNQGSFTVTHPSNSTTRTWGYLATGG